MERRNYFEILNLEFDPPVGRLPVIKKAIDAWAKGLQGLSSTGDASPAIVQELALRDDMEKVMSDVKTRNQEAKALKLKRIAQLEQLITILRTGQTGTPEVTQAQLRNVSQKLRLSIDTVSDVYTKKGFVIQKRVQSIQLRDAFITGTTFDEITRHINKLHTLTFHQFPWTPRVKDLFDFACFYAGGSDSDLAAFRRKKTSELLSIMEAGSIRYAADNSTQGHVLKDLFSIGASHIFNSEESRRKYSQSLELEKLNSFFALLKTAPEDFKKDRYFAESCIRTIQKHFPDYNLALALYNSRAGLGQDPYEPMEALIRVVCSSCHTPAEFRTQEDAQRGKCPVCGAALYIRCPQCAKHTPASADRCTCGFPIAEMQFFEDYCRAAQFALTDMDLTEARRQYENAAQAHPGHSSLPSLRSQIQKAQQIHDQYLKPLEQLIEQGRLTAAKAELSRVQTALPKLNLDRQRQRITEGLTLAQNRMPPVGASAIDRANRCIDILQSVRDFQPAIDLLRMIPPRPPVKLISTARDDYKLTCTLSWNAAGDKGVHYQVVRKRGSIPQSPSDGDILCRDLAELEYRDTDVEPGILYGYSIFACRLGTYSEPASCEMAHYSELDTRTVKAYAKDGACSFSWALPPNCLGVRILRRTNALVTLPLSSDVKVVADRASANFTDTAVINGTDYGYRLQCIYSDRNGLCYSSGWSPSTLLRPDAPPVSVRGISSKVDEQTVTIRWTAPDSVRRTVVVREARSPSVSGIRGQALAASDINELLGSSRIFASVPSSAEHCQFDIPVNSVVPLAVITFSGSQGIVSDVFQVSSVERCELDRKGTRIENGRLRICLTELPRNLERIYYLAAKKTDTRIPWGTIDDAMQHNMSMISRADYLRDGMIVVENPAKADLYITVIGRYKMDDGAVAYSEPSRLRVNNKPKQRISYQMVWGGGLFGSKTRGAKLLVKSDAPETPQMKLVCRTDGHIPMRLTDPAIQVLHTIAESDSGLTNGVYVHIFDDAVWSRLNRGTELRLMLREEDRYDYELLPENLRTLKVP